MAEKSPDAFRTIREVADWLGVPTHVLRFWESKFREVKPVKAAGGRRYYRREDILLLGGIKVLLHEQGLTIKGTQKMIEESGVDAVAAFSAEPNFTAPATQNKTRRIIRHGNEESEVSTVTGEKGGLYALEELEETVPEPEAAEVIAFTPPAHAAEPEPEEMAAPQDAGDAEPTLAPLPASKRSAAEIIAPHRAALSRAEQNRLSTASRARLRVTQRKLNQLIQRLSETAAQEGL